MDRVEHLCASVTTHDTEVVIAGAARSRSVWPLDKKELVVGFLDGDYDTWKYVADVASSWNPHSGLKLVFPGIEVDENRYFKRHKFNLPYISRRSAILWPYDGPYEGNYDIRVSFASEGWWSYIGSSALAVNPGAPTLSLGGLSSRTPLRDMCKTALHEFGHALGMIHEHQHPDSGINWNKDAVYDYYVGILGWTYEAVDAFVFRTLDRSTLRTGKYDRFSVMHYGFSKEYTTDGFYVEWPSALSVGDVEFIGQLYPLEDE